MEGRWSQIKDDWCHVGGVRNFAAIGIYADDPQYGLPHEGGWIYDLDTMAYNCVYCGKWLEELADRREVAFALLNQAMAEKDCREMDMDGWDG